MCIQKRDNDYVDYEVIGAGNLRISNSCTWQCGGKKGSVSEQNGASTVTQEV